MRATILAFITLSIFAATGVSAHGFMSEPFCRGCEKASFKVDDLKSPNTKGICRGEPAGKVTEVGHQLTLGLTITAPHVGSCEVFLLDQNLSNPIKIADKNNCAAPGQAGPMPVTIPPNISGRKVLRWHWQGCQVSPCEQYENCADINISGGGGGGNKGDEPPAPAPEDPSPAPKDPSPAPKDPSSAPKDPSSAPKDPSSAPKDSSSAPKDPASKDPAPAPPTGVSCTPGQFTCQDNKLGQCDFGKFVWTACPTGTICKSSATYSGCSSPSK